MQTYSLSIIKFMKRCFLSILTMLFILPTIYADYRPIPKTLQLEYKKEIEQVIKVELPKRRKAINNVKYEIAKEKNPYVRQTIIDYGITSILFDFYSQLIDTTDKYVSIKESLPATDWYIDLKKYITPYLKDNNINTSRINTLLDYAEKEQNYINKF